MVDVTAVYSQSQQQKNWSRHARERKEQKHTCGRVQTVLLRLAGLGVDALQRLVEGHLRQRLLQVLLQLLVLLIGILLRLFHLRNKLLQEDCE